MLEWFVDLLGLPMSVFVVGPFTHYHSASRVVVLLLVLDQPGSCTLAVWANIYLAPHPP